MTLILTLTLTARAGLRQLLTLPLAPTPKQDFGNFQNMQDMKGVFQERQKFGAHPYALGTRCTSALAVPRHPCTSAPSD